MKRPAALALVVFVLAVVPALAADRAEVLVLGTYHMANPGRDIFNMQADDVLAAKRQGEIAKVIDVLKKFNPTKIALESDVYSDRVPKAYADYLAGKHELTRNEIEQIGFRLAKELGHKTVYPADADGEFPFQRIVDYAKASGRSKELDALLGEVGAMVKAQNDYLASHTVLETLLYMNADRKVADDVGFYYRQAHFGEPGDWAGADLVSDWFRRNMRIYSIVDYAKASGRSKELDALLGEVGAMVKGQNDYLASHTVLETLLYMNADRKVADDVGFYYRQAHFGEPGDWAGADLVSDWFRRNMRIYSNVVRLIDSPNERILVLFGAGHLGWLRHDFESDPAVKLRRLAEFAQ